MESIKNLSETLFPISILNLVIPCTDVTKLKYEIESHTTETTPKTKINLSFVYKNIFIGVQLYSTIYGWTISWQINDQFDSSSGDTQDEMNLYIKFINSIISCKVEGN